MAKGKETGNFVYAMMCSATGQCYIGRTSNLLARYKQHLKDPKDAFASIVSQYGEESIIMITLKSNLTLEGSMAYEAKFIFQNYFNAELINRTFPSVRNIVRLITSADDERYWRTQFKRIDEDLCSDNPRMRYVWKKPDSLQNDLNFWLIEKERESWFAAEMRKPNMQRQLEGLEGRERKHREINLKQQIAPLCPIPSWYTQKKKFKYGICENIEQ